VAVTRFKTLKVKTSSSIASSRNSEILSANRVTGWSVNFPIGVTCQPSKLCANTCYGLGGPITWPASLSKHLRNYDWCRSDTVGFVDQLEAECMRKLSRDPNFYVRWNGVGDLFQESIHALMEINKRLPDMPVWCVTRIPEFARQLANVPNLWVHFSLDRSSLDRYTLLSESLKSASNLFFSYQCEPDEHLKELPEFISVLFFDGYKIRDQNSIWATSAVTCPLNLRKDISGTCAQCRRCFNGKAVILAKEQCGSIDHTSSSTF